MIKSVYGVSALLTKPVGLLAIMFGEARYIRREHEARCECLEPGHTNETVKVTGWRGSNAHEGTKRRLRDIGRSSPASCLYCVSGGGWGWERLEGWLIVKSRPLAMNSHLFPMRHPPGI